MMNRARMIIPYEKLSLEALNGLIEEFVTRPGTDTGYTKNTLKQNVDMVKRHLKRADILVVYDECTQTANIIPKEKLKEVKKIKLPTASGQGSMVD
jgi:uncharacterized protein YheU (UPF0270 family)